MRILHVVGRMHRGGIETWLMHVLRQIDRDRFSMDFLVHDSEPGDYDAEVEALGSQVIVCPHHSPWNFAKRFKAVLKTHGPYDVVHSHIHHYSGLILRLAHQMGVPVRIAHSHTDTSTIDAQAGPLRQGYFALMRHWLTCYATARLGVSQSAAVSLFGANGHADLPWQVLPCGIDLAPFQQSTDSARLRADLNIPTNAFVMGHVGRFVPLKNQAFLLTVLRELIDQGDHSYLLFVGDGPLRETIAQMAIDLNVIQFVRFAGSRPDVPQLMQGVMNVLLFPSLYEGLGLVLIEAQAANLPCVISDTLPSEIDLCPALIHRLSLVQSASDWAQAALKWRNHPLPAVSGFQTLTASVFNIKHNLQQLELQYLKV